MSRSYRNDPRDDEPLGRRPSAISDTQDVVPKTNQRKQLAIRSVMNYIFEIEPDRSLLHAPAIRGMKSQRRLARNGIFGCREDSGAKNRTDPRYPPQRPKGLEKGGRNPRKNADLVISENCVAKDWMVYSRQSCAKLGRYKARVRTGNFSSQHAETGF